MIQTVSGFDWRWFAFTHWIMCSNPMGHIRLFEWGTALRDQRHG